MGLWEVVKHIGRSYGGVSTFVLSPSWFWKADPSANNLMTGMFLGWMMGLIAMIPQISQTEYGIWA